MTRTKLLSDRRSQLCSGVDLSYLNHVVMRSEVHLSRELVVSTDLTLHLKSQIEIPYFH